MKIKLNLNKEMFNSKYMYMLNNKETVNVLYGGGGSGKSYFVSNLIVIKLLKEKRKALVCRRYATTLKASIFQDFLNTLVKFKILNYCKINLSTMTILFPNGSQILFRGLDDIEKIKSISSISDIVIEEASEIREADFEQMTIRLRGKTGNNQLFLMFNPVSKANWVYNKWFNPKTSKNDGDTYVLKTTWKDNKFLPDSFIKQLLKYKTTNPTFYKVYAEGDFATLSQRIVEKFTINDKIDKDNIFSLDPNIKIIGGLDFGYMADPTAFILVGYSKSLNTIFILEEFYFTKLKNDDIANLLKLKGFNKLKITADSAEQKSIQEIKDFGISRIKGAKKGKGSINQGIQFINQHAIVVSPKCVNFITELENYVYKKDKNTGYYVNTPEDSYNHLMDALRYALEDIKAEKTIKASGQ